MVSNKKMRWWKNVYGAQQDLKNGLNWSEVLIKYNVARSTLADWRKIEVPENVLAKLKGYKEPEFLEVEREKQKRNIHEVLNMNPLEFIESENGLNFKLFPMQELMVKVFYGMELTNEEREILNKLKKAGKTNWKEGEKYTEFVLMVGMKGGKTELISALSLYEEKELYRLGNPQKHYGLPAGKEIYIINVAAEREQARDTIFASTQARIKNSKFYQSREKKESVSSYEFPNGVKLYSGHSSSSSIVGRTAKAVIFDELARFVEKKTGKSSGHKVYNSLNRSVAPFKENARIFSLSSTIHEHDMINNLYSMCFKVDGMLGFKLATWEMNPNLPFDCPFLQRELKKSPEDFWRDYGCQPARALEKYYRDRLKIDKAFFLGSTSGLKNPINDDGSFKDWFKGNTEFNYHLHLDPAVNNCSFGVSLAYKKGDKVLVPLAHQFKAETNKEIDFKEMEEFLGLLADRFPTIKAVTYDCYIAVSLYQALEKRGLKAEFLSVQKKQHDDLKIEGIYKERVLMYPNKVLERELKELDLINGSKVDHPEGGTKDIADAVAGAVSKAFGSEEVEAAVASSQFITNIPVERNTDRVSQIQTRKQTSITHYEKRRSLIWG